MHTVRRVSATIICFVGRTSEKRPGCDRRALSAQRMTPPRARNISDERALASNPQPTFPTSYCTPLCALP